MSRTYKDKPAKLSPNHWRNDTDTVHGFAVVNRYSYFYDKVMKYEKYFSISLPTSKPKKRKEVDTENHWMTTPSWWVHKFMIKPQRRAGTLWERKVLKTKVSDIEECDKPSVSRKPHVYFW